VEICEGKTYEKYYYIHKHVVFIILTF